MMSILILSILLALYMAWSIGGNDVANSMGTSVGSRSLTLRQAIVIASLANFFGAYFLGSHVTETIRKGIVDPFAFRGIPNELMLGMIASLLAAGFWVQISTHLGLPVSTTHSIVGAIIGFAFFSVGPSHVDWLKLFFIVLSWILSPLLGGVISFLLFLYIKRAVFSKDDPYEAILKRTPIFLGFVLSFILIFIFYKSGSHLPFRNIGFVRAFLIALLSGILMGFLSLPLLRKLTKGEDGYQAAERVFSFLQVATATYMAFSHGANDVANAIGPVSSVFSIWREGVVGVEAPVPAWILLLGGFGIALGISTFGYKVIRTVGEEITDVTPSRGFASEFGAATTVLLASKLGLPVSSTHCLVGAVIGVGLARGIAALNLGVIKNIMNSWLLTLPATALLSGFIYLFLTSIF